MFLLAASMCSHDMMCTVHLLCYNRMGVTCCCSEKGTLFTHIMIRLVLVFSLSLVFVIQADTYIGITPGCAASESGVTSPELLIMFPCKWLS